MSLQILQAAADKTPVYRDPDVEPEPIACEKCDASMHWVWYEYKGVLRAKWLQPPFDSCDDCRADAKARSDLESFRARQRAAGIPERYWRYSFSNPTMQPLHTGPEIADIARRDREMTKRHRDFQTHCKAAGKVGVTDGNVDAFEFLRDWKPGGGSAWLWGLVGGGKTHLASMFASKWLRPNGEEREVYIDGVMHLQLNLPKRVLFTSDELLLAASQKANSDRRARREDGAGNPVPALLAADLVIYDDLGTKDGKWIAELREEVVGRRYDRMAPTIFTSNDSPAGTKHLFSPRMGDRIDEMLGGERGVFALRDLSWRQA